MSQDPPLDDHILQTAKRKNLAILFYMYIIIPGKMLKKKRHLVLYDLEICIYEKKKIEQKISLFNIKNVQENQDGFQLTFIDTEKNQKIWIEKVHENLILRGKNEITFINYKSCLHDFLIIMIKILI